MLTDNGTSDGANHEDQIADALTSALLDALLGPETGPATDPLADVEEVMVVKAQLSLFAQKRLLVSTLITHLFFIVLS
jgi:hypothetical protein